MLVFKTKYSHLVMMYNHYNILLNFIWHSSVKNLAQKDIGLWLFSSHLSGFGFCISAIQTLWDVMAIFHFLLIFHTTWRGVTASSFKCLAWFTMETVRMEYFFGDFFKTNSISLQLQGYLDNFVSELIFVAVIFLQIHPFHLLIDDFS